MRTVMNSNAKLLPERAPIENFAIKFRDIQFWEFHTFPFNGRARRHRIHQERTIIFLF